MIADLVLADVIASFDFASFDLVIADYVSFDLGTYYQVEVVHDDNIVLAFVVGVALMLWGLDTLLGWLVSMVIG